MTQLTQEQIELYTSISGATIDFEKSKEDKKGRYWTVTKSNYGKFRTAEEILKYIQVKTNKTIGVVQNDEQHNIEHNNIHINKNNNVEFIKGNKTRRLCLNMTLTMDEFKKLQTIGRANNITWSNAATQIVKSYIKNMQ